MPNVSNISLTKGFDPSYDPKVITYLYGLSDFWRTIFQDPEIIDATLHGQSLTASEIYNNFLQMTSALSLEGISTTLRSQLKMQTVNSNSRITGKLETYLLPDNVVACRLITNRPFLSTATLEQGTHFHIDSVTNTISFYAPLSGLGFPSRLLPDGSTDYSIWMVDAEVDEALLYKTYGKLINITPEASTEQYKSFVQGMYYLYSNGPSLTVLKRGLNLIMGIPTARETETVLDTRFHQVLDQWMVVTDMNAYFLPYGLIPSVVVGDNLTINQELTAWVDVQDRVTNGDWWINLSIPTTLIPSTSLDQQWYATSGSDADYLMRNYLAANTFLIQINLAAFKDKTKIASLTALVKDIRPAYTNSINVWALPKVEDTLTASETLLHTISARFYDLTGSGNGEGMGEFTRDLSAPFLRNQPAFTRFQGNKATAKVSGGLTQPAPRAFNGGMITKAAGMSYFDIGYAWSADDAKELAWLHAVSTRTNGNFAPSRTVMIRGLRGPVATPTEGVGATIQTGEVGKRTVYLCSVRASELASKLNSIGVTLDQSAWSTSYKPSLSTLQTNLVLLGTRTGDLPKPYPDMALQGNYATSGDLREGDYLLFAKSSDTVYGVWLITSNLSLVTKYFVRPELSDNLSIRITGTPTRGMYRPGLDYYETRSGNYSDTLNAGITSNRSNVTLVTNREL